MLMLCLFFLQGRDDAASVLLLVVHHQRVFISMLHCLRKILPAACASAQLEVRLAA